MLPSWCLIGLWSRLRAPRTYVPGGTRLIIGENCKIGPNAYIWSHTAVGDRCHISSAEVYDSIVMEDTVINVERKLVRSMIGKGSKIMSSNGLLPKGERLIVGENTTLHL